tara:strand:+ start:3472 stop:4008 length:537 start_codon:yes stop_codon:yes gene_type:complete
MNDFIFVKKNALSKKKCQSIIDVLDTAVLKPGNSEGTKNFYSGTHADVYKSEWSEDLFKCMLEYKDQHKFLDNKHLCRWNIIPNCNYQKYKPRQSYAAEHCEHGGKEYESRRMIVWSIYCNTIKEGGETYFPQQDVNIHPEQGTIAIWPASWTHSHYGKPALKEYKYIVTGWANYEKL